MARFGGLLHHAVIDRDVFAEREGFGELRVEIGMAEGGQARKQGRGFRQVMAQRVEDSGRFPEKHAGIPVEIPGGDKFLGLGKFWLFAELGDGGGGEFAAFRAGGKFDVAVAGFGPAGFDSQNGDLAVYRGAEGGFEKGGVAGGVADDVVGGEDAEDGTGVEGMKDVRGEADGGRGVALGRFGDDLRGGNRGEL